METNMVRVVTISLIIVSIATPAAAQIPPTTPPVQAPARLTFTPEFARGVQRKTPDVSRAAVSRHNAADVQLWGGSSGQGESRPSLLKQAQTLGGQQARAVVSAAAPPRRRNLANWQKQVLFWGGIAGGLILWGVLESEWD
jgi:hypothetical protein